MLKIKKNLSKISIIGILAIITAGVIIVASNQKTLTQKSIDGKLLSPSPQPRNEIISKPTKIPIILYHYIEHVKDKKDTLRQKLNINPEEFERQLQSIKSHNYSSYMVKDIPGLLRNNDHKGIILTIDDGYEDFYTDAFPLLKKYNIKSTLYVVYNLINKKGYLTEAQLREIINSGLVEIGSHSVDHINLASKTNSEQEHQIKESKRALQELFKIDIQTFAYPYGKYNTTSVQLAKEAGYSIAVSVNTGTIQSENNLFTINRIRPGMFIGKDMIETIEKLND